MSNLLDSANYPTVEPDDLIAGDRWAWKRSDIGTDYSPSLYTLKYSMRLEGTGTTEIEITASASGTDYLIEVASATTAAYDAGRYHWQAYITRDADAERVMIDTGTVTVVANRDEATTDPRTHARITLDAIEAVLENRATQGEKSYTINNRSLERTPIDELLKLRNTYRSEVRAEEAAAKQANDGGHDGSLVVTRMQG